MKLYTYKVAGTINVVAEDDDDAAEEARDVLRYDRVEDLSVVGLINVEEMEDDE